MMRILVAEDDLTSRTVLTAVLTKQGYEVVQATDGGQALESMLRQDAPQLAILDWMMPVMDGLEVIRQVRARQGERTPYLIMLTARNSKADVIAGLDAGADDYLAKPFDPGELRSRVGVGRRMVEMQSSLLASRAALMYEASHDALTGLLNRRAILAAMQQGLGDTVCDNDRLMAVGLCDIDHFKQVNDRFGHQAGDEVLRAFAERARAELVNGEALGRLGGEEFLVIAPVPTASARRVEQAGVFERLCVSIGSRPFITNAGSISLTTSIGVAFGTCDGQGKSKIDALLEASDRALYKAKALGRNRVETASELV